MKLAHPELQTRLAAEYVLGTMKGRARRRFEDYLRMPEHRALRAEVAKWEAHMTPMANAIPAIDPPKRVWARIDAQLFGSKTPALTGDSSQNVPKTPANQGLFGLGFWRNLGLGASGLAAVLLVVMFTGLPKTEEPMMTAVLEDQGGARMVIDQRHPDRLEAKLIRNWNSSGDISHELWVIPADGAPRSLGVVADTGNTMIQMPGLSARLAGGAVFAVSLEPKGGSPTGAPTGRVVCKGAIAKMPPKARPQI
jgi:anti-sigma-K factor RskA